MIHRKHAPRAKTPHEIRRERALREWLTLHTDPRGDVRAAKARQARIHAEATRRPMLGRLVDVLAEVLLDKQIAEEGKA